MDEARDHESHQRTPVALTVLTAIVYVAAFAMIIAWFVLVVLGQPRAATGARAEPFGCRVCGVVEAVREIEPARAQALEGSRAEGTVTLLAALCGAAAPGARPAKIYETSVRHDDGYVRVVRDTGAPPWKSGDRVKVIRGRVEPAAQAAAMQPPAAAAPDASPPERTPSPGPQAARAP